MSKRIALESLIPPTYDAKFGGWIRHQRNCYKNGLLSKEKINKLELIPGWHWNCDFKWFEKFNKLNEFILNGNPFPPMSHREFGIWVKKQRYFYNKGKLSKERIDKLESISGWFWEVDLESIWFEKANSLDMFMRSGNSFPSHGNKEFSLWAKSQRDNYKKGKLSKERIDKLESISGWFWEKDRNLIWFEKANSLKMFILNGNPFPPMTDKQFGVWVNFQRKQYKKGRLSKENIQQLESIPGWFWSRYEKG